MKNYLIVMAGLPGAGKTTTGKLLAEKLGYEFISQNDVRREYGMKEMPESQSRLQRDIDKRIANLLQEGSGVVMDAAHRYGGRRHQLYGIASGLGKDVVVVEPTASEETAKKRMTERPEGDGLLVDARDPSVYDKVKAGWEPVGEEFMDYSDHVSYVVYDTEAGKVDVKIVGHEADGFIEEIKKALS